MPHRAREAFELYRTSQREFERVQAAVYSKLARLGEGQDEERRNQEERLVGARDREFGARLAFIQEFDKSDWSEWTLPEDGALLEQGLLGVGERFQNSDPQRSVLALEELLERLPDCESANRVGYYLLPLSLLCLGDPELAERKMRALLETLPAAGGPTLKIFLGDALALQDDLEGARAVWREALEETPEGLRDGDPRKRVIPEAELRLATLGQPPPEIDSEVWFGWQPTPISSLCSQGEVVLLDFWSTGSPACRALAPLRDDFYAEKASDGLLFVGVTRVTEQGFLPEMRHAMNAGVSVESMDAEAFREHLQLFRKNTGVTYPFVVAGDEEFERYGVFALPTTFFVGRDGRVRFVMMSGGRASLLEWVVAKLLAEEPPPAAGKSGR